MKTVAIDHISSTLIYTMPFKNPIDPLRGRLSYPSYSLETEVQVG